MGGFLAGVGLGIIFLKSGVAKMARYDNPTLLDYMGKREPPANKTKRDDSSCAGSMAELTSNRAHSAMISFKDASLDRFSSACLPAVVARACESA